MSSFASPAPALSPSPATPAPHIGSAWSDAAAIAAQAVSSTTTAQRHAAKESLCLLLQSVSHHDWPALCDLALQWMRCQVLPSGGKPSLSGGSGLVTAACALIQENACRCSSQAHSLPAMPLAEAVESVSPPAAAAPLLNLSVAREVNPALPKDGCATSRLVTSRVAVTTAVDEQRRAGALGLHTSSARLLQCSS